jgi:hypothetical protein
MSAIAAIEDKAHRESGRNVRNSVYRDNTHHECRKNAPFMISMKFFKDPLINNRELFTDMNHPVAGVIKQLDFLSNFHKPQEEYTQIHPF